MTKLLEQAIGKIRELPDADQDEAAEVLLLLVSRVAGREQLDDESRAAVREGLAQAERGEFATDEEIAAIFGLDRRKE